MKNTSAQRLLILGMLLVVSLACRMCSDETPPRVFDPARFNPYAGSLLTLVTKQVGAFKYKESHSVNYAGAADAIEATYQQQLGNFVSIEPDSIVLRAVNFATAAEADKEIQKAVAALHDKSKFPYLKVSDWRPNTMNGVTIGKIVNAQGSYDHRAEFAERVYWTNGSLFCAADARLSNTHASAFQQAALY